jgi:uncharacterized protein YhjY with autotransporter beta-barrel domain
MHAMSRKQMRVTFFMLQDGQVRPAIHLLVLAATLLWGVPVQDARAACVVESDGITVTCTGDEPGGITSGSQFSSPPITTLQVYTHPIETFANTIGGISFSNATASSVNVFSGAVGSPVSVTTHGASAPGIKALSEGSPSGYHWESGLGLYVPNGPAGGGGPVTVANHGAITTGGTGSHGILVQNRVGAYDPLTALTLFTFDVDAVTASLVSVAGSSASIGVGVSGDEGGTFTLDSDGTISFVRGTLGDTLQPGESIITSITYQVLLERGVSFPFISAGSQVSDGTVSVKIVNDDGDITVEPLEISFAEFGVKSDPGGTAPLWPDIQGYVNRLKAEAGLGGAGESIAVTNSGSITTTGANAHGIYAETTGGNGGTGREGGLFDGPAGVGGTGSGGGGAEVTANGNITTYGNEAAGVAAVSRGGTGGTGGDGGWGGWRWGGQGGTGGDGGNVSVYGSGTIETGAIPEGQTGSDYGDYASGIIALSEGGNGGNGGEGHQGMPGGSGGFGGTGGTVVVDGSWDITTRGEKAHGIWAKSVGGNAGSGGSGGWLGGSGGAGGQATDGGSVTVASGGEISTFGSDSFGLYAQSVGGFGGTGGVSTGIFYSRGGDGNSAGSGGAVTVTNEASGAITTRGARGHGIYAQSVGGGGGSGGGAGALVGFGGAGAYGGNGGSVTVANEGAILTYGENARGIYAQSVGGGGGDGGDSGGFVAVGGSGSGTSDGKSVSVTNSGLIETTGYRSYGIFAESVGGGGGDGGDSGGIFTIGGKGGGGGNADTVTVANSGTLKTVGGEASAIFAQSVGGGGGNGGGAVAVGQLSVAVGGAGGAGGYGMKVSVDTDSGSAISTTGDRAYGILAQSVGGGGGNGGFAIAAGTGNGMHIAIGGTGGDGGAGGEVEVHAGGTIDTGSRDLDTGAVLSGDNAHGIFAQSVGGGGGSGGFAVSGAIGGVNFNLALGGSGGDGGSADQVTVGTESDPILAAITTLGDRAYGILAQSIGGGGGDGGFAVSASVASTTSLNLAVGGDGGGGGAGKEVELHSAGSVHTWGTYAHGIFAQSVGGGGGNGGFAITGSVASGAALDLSFGGDGGRGSTGDDVIAWNNGDIITEGEQSYGVLAQSIGGGGGNGGMSMSGGLTAFGGLNFSMGGNGGDGNSGGSVSAVNDLAGTIETRGEYSHGIFAQSVGGGGGNGGTAGSVTVNFSSLIPIPEPYPTGSANFSISLGGEGGQGGAGGQVDVANKGNIFTREDSAYGILAQSVGGGGGAGGKSVAATGNISLPEDPGTGAEKPQLEVKIDFALAIGGKGGDGNHGGLVEVTNDGAIDTSGVNSHGIFAQSVGGGGGAGGDARSMTLSIDPSNSSLFPSEPPPSLTSIEKAVNISVGGSAGGGNDGGQVRVSNRADIITRNADAYGIFAQSVGGGGGAGGGGYHGLDWSELGVPEDLVDIVEAVMPVESQGDVVVAVGGSGGASGTGDTVYVDTAGSIVTLGDGSFGILAQSIGGGGGTGGVGAVGEEGTVGLGGRGGVAGDGGLVEIIVNGAIATTGKAAHGIIAQSIGGGGGIAGNVDRGVEEFGLDLSFNPDLNALFTESLPDGFIPEFNLDFNGDGGGAGHGGDVTITATSGDITTRGTGAYGIFAQSVGGGGGLAGGVGSSSGFAGSVGGDGSGGTVTIDYVGDITTYGNAAHGVFAQSAGGQKDAGVQQTTSTDANDYFKPVKDALGNFIFGTSALTDLADRGGDVAVTVQGDVLAHGADSHGILTQSRGADGNGDITVTVTSGTIRGGSGNSVGVHFMDGAANTLENHGTIATLNGISGTALRATGGSETVNNHGTITGSVELGSGTNAFTNGLTGIFNSGAAANLGSGNLFSNGGTLSPGGSGAFLATVLTGNFTQTATGTLALEIDRSGDHDKLVVGSGTATLAGMLSVNRGAGPYGNGMTYDLVEAVAAPFVGVFDTLSLPTGGPLLSFSVNQSSNLVTLEVSAPSVTTVASNPVEAVLAEYLDRIMPTATGDLALALGEFQSLTADQFSEAFVGLSPVTYQSLSHLHLAGIGQYLGTLRQRMGYQRLPMLRADADSRAPILLAYAGSLGDLGRLTALDQPGPSRSRNGFWLNGFGQWGEYRAKPGYSSHDYSLYGSSLGYDQTFGNDLLLGVSVGLSRVEADFGSSRGDGSVNAITGALYGSYSRRNLFLEGVLSYGRNHFNNRRTVTIGALQSTASSSHDGDAYSAYLAGGYDYRLERTVLTPYAVLRYSHLAEESFSETGAGSLNLQVARRSTDSLISEMGLRAAHVVRLEKGSLVPELSFAWTYDFELDDQIITSSFAGASGATFSVRGENLARFGAIVGAGLTYANDLGFSTVLRYRGEFRDQQSAHGVLGELRYAF